MPVHPEYDLGQPSGMDAGSSTTGINPFVLGRVPHWESHGGNYDVPLHDQYQAHDYHSSARKRPVRYAGAIPFLEEHSPFFSPPPLPDDTREDLNIPTFHSSEDQPHLGVGFDDSHSTYSAQGSNDEEIPSGSEIPSLSSAQVVTSEELGQKFERLERKEATREIVGSSRANRHTSFWRSLHIKEKIALVKKVAELTHEDPNFLWNRLDVRCDESIARAIFSEDTAQQLQAIWEIDSYHIEGDMLKIMEKRRLNRLLQTKYNLAWKSANNVRTMGGRTFTAEQKRAIRDNHYKSEQVYEFLAEKLYASYLLYHETRNATRREERKERKRLAEEFDLV